MKYPLEESSGERKIKKRKNSNTARQRLQQRLLMRKRRIKSLRNLMVLVVFQFHTSIKKVKSLTH